MGDRRIDIAGAAWLIVAIVILGAAIALLFIFFRRVIPEPALLRTGMVSLKRRGPIPYGIAIARGPLQRPLWDT